MVESPLRYGTEQYRTILEKCGYNLVYVSGEGFDNGVVCIIFDAKTIDWNDYNERKDKRKIVVLREEEFIRNYQEILESV